MRPDDGAEGLVAETSAGRVRGMFADRVHAFLGVPYAATTTGRSRFRPPRPHPGWAGVREATSYGPASPQRPLTEALGARTAVTSLLPLFGIPTEVRHQGEDCLVLNLWTAGLDPRARRPVLLWLHGGTDFGAGDWPRFDGAALAREGGLVVVTVNHRLGLFGHLDLGWTGVPEYAESGRSGLLDLRAALDWVRLNAESFGGDPTNITLAGCSRGASRIAALLSLTGPEPPFQRVILVSPPPMHRTTAALSAREASRSALSHLGLPTTRPGLPGLPGLLADVPVHLLLAAQARLRAEHDYAFQPVVDGARVEQRCYADLAAGACPRVPVMIGSTLNETTRMIGADPASWEGLGDTELTRRCARIVCRDVTDPAEVDLAEAGMLSLIDEHRRQRHRDSAYRTAVAVTTDAMYRFPALALASARSAAASAPTYAYVFSGGTGSHGEDILFFFDNLRHASLVPRHRANAELADAASAAWITFCHTGRPEVPGVGPWPAHTEPQRSTLLFGNPTRAVTDPFASRRATWARACRPDWEAWAQGPAQDPVARNSTARSNAESRFLANSSFVKTGSVRCGGIPGPSKVVPDRVRNSSFGCHAPMPP